MSGETADLALYFLDTSALAKYYRRELGSDWIERLFADGRAQRVISRLAVVEMESVFSVKIRTGEITTQAVLTARKRLESDLGRRSILVSSFRDEDLRFAKLLLTRYGSDHGLRTLDALQLAAVSAIRRAGFTPVFVAADRRLCRVAEMEAFRVSNPEQSATVVI